MGYDCAALRGSGARVFVCEYADMGYGCAALRGSGTRVFLPVIVQRLALMVLSVQKPVVLPQAQYLDKVVPFPLSTTGAYGLTVLKTAVSPQLQFVDVVVDISVVVQRQFYGPVQDHRASPVAVH